MAQANSPMTLDEIAASIQPEVDAALLAMLYRMEAHVKKQKKAESDGEVETK